MTMRLGHRHGWAAASAAALLALAACVAFAGAPASRTSRAKAGASPAPATTVAAKPVAPAATSAVVPAGTLGLMAFLDPETGQLTGPIGYLVPPADQRAANANVLLVPVPTPGGGWLLDLKGTGMESYVLQVDPLGNRRVVCVRDPRLVPVLLPLPVPAAGEER